MADNAASPCRPEPAAVVTETLPPLSDQAVTSSASSSSGRLNVAGHAGLHELTNHFRALPARQESADDVP